MVLTALESVYSQTLPPREVIVVVDGDTDGTPAAVRRAYPDAMVLEQPASLGAARARTDGFAAATAEWVCLLDDDDVWHSKKQEECARYVAEHPECEALRTAFWQFSTDEAMANLNGFLTEIYSADHRSALEAASHTATALNNFDYLDIEGRSLAEMLRKNCGVTSSTMFRRSLVPLLPPVPDDLRTAQDWLLFVYIAQATEWHLVPGRWFFYRVHSDQVTSTLGSDRWRYRVAAWELAWKNAGTSSGLRLSDYANEYSWEVHTWVWQEIRNYRPRRAAQAFVAGSRFIASRAGRVSVAIPPPLRWRIRGYLNRTLSVALLR